MMWSLFEQSPSDGHMIPTVRRQNQNEALHRKCVTMASTRTSLQREHTDHAAPEGVASLQVGMERGLCITQASKHQCDHQSKQYQIVNCLRKTSWSPQQRSLNSGVTSVTITMTQWRQRLRPLLLLLLTIGSDWKIDQVQASWIDPATPMDVRTTTALNVKAPPPTTDTKSTTSTKHHSARHSESPTSAPTSSTESPTKSPTTSPSAYPTYDPERVYELVFSDEFNVPHREFYDGADPRWTA